MAPQIAFHSLSHLPLLISRRLQSDSTATSSASRAECRLRHQRSTYDRRWKSGDGDSRGEGPAAAAANPTHVPRWPLALPAPVCHSSSSSSITYFESRPLFFADSLVAPVTFLMHVCMRAGDQAGGISCGRMGATCLPHLFASRGGDFKCRTNRESDARQQLIGAIDCQSVQPLTFCRKSRSPQSRDIPSCLVCGLITQLAAHIVCVCQ